MIGGLGRAVRRRRHAGRCGRRRRLRRGSAVRAGPGSGSARSSSTSGSPTPCRTIARIVRFCPQCDISTGSDGCRSRSRLTPPNRPSNSARMAESRRRRSGRRPGCRGWRTSASTRGDVAGIGPVRDRRRRRRGAADDRPGLGRGAQPLCAARKRRRSPPSCAFFSNGIASWTARVASRLAFQAMTMFSPSGP